MGVITSGWEPNGIIREQKAEVEITPMVLLEDRMFSYIAAFRVVCRPVSDRSGQQNFDCKTHSGVYCSRYVTCHMLHFSGSAAEATPISN